MIIKKVNSFLILIISLIWLYFFIGYGYENDVLGGDSLGYYSYLPATFIYDNLTHMETSGNELDVPEKIRDYVIHGPYDNPKTPLDKYLVQYTIGTALMELPFFLIGHLSAKVFHYSKDGLSFPYYTAIKFSNFIYLLIGFLFIYKSLSRFFDKNLSRFICLLLILGTNLLFFSSYHFGMSHLPLFFLYSVIIFYTIKLHEKSKTYYFLILGFCIGLISLIRVTDAVAILIPVLYRLNDWNDIKLKWQLLIQNKIKVVLATLLFIIPILPQLIYWKIMSGSYFYYSYGNQKLDLSKPHLIDGWLGSDNGWLHYSPMMILSILGFVFLKRNKAFGIATVVIFIIYSYLIYSWFCFQYVNGFGSRPMIDIYPLLAFPLAAFVSFVLERGYITKFIFASFLVLTIFINLSFTYKQLNGQLWSEYSSFTFNASTIFNYHIDKKDLVTMDIPYLQPRNLENFSEKVKVNTSFENDINAELDSVSNSKVLKIENVEYSNVLASTILKFNDTKDLEFIRISGNFYLYNSPYYYYRLSELAFNIKRGEESIFNKACKIDNKLWNENEKSNRKEKVNLFEVQLNQWSEVEFFIPYPIYKELKEGDIIEVYINNQAKSKMLVDNLKISYLYRK